MAGISSRKSDDDWRIDSDLSTLQEAERIKADPKRLAAAQSRAKDKLLELASVAAESPKKS